MVPFNADSSLLYRVLLRDSVVVPNEPICCRMPKNADPLPISQQTTIYNWINEGAQGPNLLIDLKNLSDRIVVSTSPNPFNNILKISIRSENIFVENIAILNLLGERVRTIEVHNQTDGVIFWDGSNDFGQAVTAGIYFIYFYQNSRLELIRKVLFLK